MKKTSSARSASILAILSILLLVAEPALAGSCGEDSNVRAINAGSNFRMRVNAAVSSGSDGWWVVKRFYIKNEGKNDLLYGQSGKILPLSSSKQNIYAHDVRNSDKETTTKLEVTFANDPLITRATASFACNFQVKTWLHTSGVIETRKAQATSLNCAGNENVSSCERVFRAGDAKRFEWTIVFKKTEATE
jgi:hypothetical protein